jgi:multidrug efflux pump
VLVTGPCAQARNSIGTVLVAGMLLGTLFTLFVVPVFYSLIAVDHAAAKARERETEVETDAPANAALGMA